jgi:hypothetical protein
MGVFLGAKFIEKGEAVDPIVANVPTSGFAEKLMNPHMALGGQAISIQAQGHISAHHTERLSPALIPLCHPVSPDLPNRSPHIQYHPYSPVLWTVKESAQD